jgi:hypothetical protein
MKITLAWSLVFTFTAAGADSTFTDANWTSMGGIAGADAPVSAAVVDQAGNLYIGGDFGVVGDVTANRIAKWNGTSWSSLGSGMNERVAALAVLGTNLYASGYFTTAGGAAASYIAKWNGSGWSGLGSGMDSFVYGLAVSGSDLYAAGAFRTAGGIRANGIAKWDGSSWSTLGSGMGGGGPLGTDVFALAASGNDVYAAGRFTTAGGSAATNIAKWNGSSWSALGSGMDGPVFALALSAGELYVSGNFTKAGGNAANRIAKWNGTGWSGLGSGIDGDVIALAVSVSDIYAAGAFAMAGGTEANSIAKWDGTSWTAPGSGIVGESDYGAAIWALAVSGHDVYVGGGFFTAGGRAVNHIAKWNGTNWSALGSGLGGGDGVSTIAASGSEVYAGGRFRTVGGTAANYVAKWNGSSWSALGSGLNERALALAISGANVYAGGMFTNAGDRTANHIANWDGRNWTALGSGMNAEVDALAVSGGELYAGGDFTMAGDIAANHIARWNGTNWFALGTGMNGPVRALVVSGNDIYAAGGLTADGSGAIVAKWNGSSWTELGLSGMGGAAFTAPFVAALAVSGSDLYAGGYFTTADATPANYVAKWDGIKWSALGSGMRSVFPGFVDFPPVLALAVSGHDLYAAGRFTTADGRAVNFIAKWDGSTWTGLGSGLGGTFPSEITGGSVPSASALAVSGNDLFVGGSFTTAGAKVSAYVARAYLLPLPALSVRRAGTDVMVSWPSVDTASFALELASTLARPLTWASTVAVTDDATNKSVTLPSSDTQQFFRLRRP